MAQRKKNVSSCLVIGLLILTYLSTDGIHLAVNICNRAYQQKRKETHHNSFFLFAYAPWPHAGVVCTCIYPLLCNAGKKETWTIQPINAPGLLRLLLRCDMAWGG